MPRTQTNAERIAFIRSQSTSHGPSYIVKLTAGELTDICDLALKGLAAEKAIEAARVVLRRDDAGLPITGVMAENLRRALSDYEPEAK